MTREHIYPVNDLKEHVIDEGQCWCEPYIDIEHNLVIHNAADGRDFFEEEEREALLQGLADMKAGRVVSYEEVKRSLNYGT